MTQYVRAPKEKIRLVYPGRHCEIQIVQFRPHSDEHNSPVWILPYIPRAMTWKTLSGKVFFIRSVLDERSLVILSYSPDIVDAELLLTDSETLELDANGYDCAYWYCPYGDEEKTMRAHFAERCPLQRFTLLNNWGEGNRAAGVYEAGILQEIDAAAEIGLDVIQIDDGWQKGNSAETQVINPDGTPSPYCHFDGDFWDCDREKFPRGLEYIVEYARSKNIAMGLWFAPDSHDHFVNFERDLAVLRHAYEIGFRYFKLDFLVLCDREDVSRYLEFLEQVAAIGEDVRLQLDVTSADKRIGFLQGCNLETVFLENRYSCREFDYMPYLTLRVLWQLSRYFPAARFQLELPNGRKFRHPSSDTDPLNVFNYSAAWRFASIMVSCPLFWMEARHFSEEERASLLPLLNLWKQHRAHMESMDVCPVGDEPNGVSNSGFLLTGERDGYLVALRDFSKDGMFSVCLPENARSLEILSASDGVTAALENGTAQIRFPEKRTYAFCHFELAK